MIEGKDNSTSTEFQNAESKPEKSSSKSNGFLRWIPGVILLALLLGSGGWLLFRSPSPKPPQPPEIKDPEVREKIEQARKGVIEKPTASNWGYLGMVLLAHRFDQEAKVAFREASRLDQGDSRWYFCQGMIALKYEPEEALVFFHEAIRVNTWPDYQFRMEIQPVETLLERSDFERAQKEINKINGTGLSKTDFERLTVNRGWLAMARGDYDDARRQFSLVQESPFARKNAKIQLASLARLAGNPVDAERLEKEAVKLPPDQDWPESLLREVMDLGTGRRFRELTLNKLEKTKQYAEAAQIYIQLLKKEPTPENYVGAGMNLARNKEYEAAIPYLLEAVRLDPSNLQYRFNLATTYFRRAEEHQNKFGIRAQDREDFTRAIENCKLAVEGKPDNSIALLVWGASLKYLGQYESALIPLKQGIAIRPEDFELQYTLAEVYLKLGKLEEAKKHFEIARGINPRHPQIPRLEEQLKPSRT